MNEISVNTNPDKLMVVAHPDDESLFGGAQLITEPGWKVVCVTNGRNPVRKGEFHEVMYVTNSRFEMWDYYDEQYTPLDYNPLREDLRRVVNEQEWSKIVTHNRDGEYGHLHHKQINELMRELVGDKLWTFYLNGPDLPEDVWCEKLALVDIYESQKEICDGHIKNVRGETVTKGEVNQKLL